MPYANHLLTFFLVSFFCLQSSAVIASPPRIELYSAYQEILANTYGLKAADAEVYAKEADKWQAGAHPNPALSANLNSIARNQGGNENELFVGVTNVIELGGKRSARLRVASMSQLSAECKREIAKNELFATLLHAFINMASAQERLVLAKEQQIIAEQILHAISTKTTAGKTSGIEQKKAEVDFRSATLDYLKQYSTLQKTKKQLTAQWDCNAPTFDAVTFPLYQLPPPPPIEKLKTALKYSPEVLKAQAEALFAYELVALEKSRSIPDLAVQVGVTAEKFVQQAALSIGFTIPLPLFDQNEGNINRASFDQLQTVYKQMDLENHLQKSLEILYHEWQSIYEQVVFLKDSILPCANEAFCLAQESYDEAKVDYLSFLNARGALFNVQQSYLNAIEEYHHKRADVIRLTATYTLSEM